MNPAYVWIATAIVAGGIGTFLQAIGSAKGEGEPAAKTRRRHVWLGMGTLLTAFAVYCLWNGQQKLIQDAAVKPVIDVSVDLNKTLRIKNFGTVDFESVSVDATIYVLKGSLKGGHIAISGIDSFSRLSQPIWGPQLIRQGGGEAQVDFSATPAAPLLPIYEGIPDLARPEGRTVYSFRVTYRNGVTKERLVRHIFVGAFKGFPDMYGDYRGAAVGGGYESSMRVFEIRDLLRSHQLKLFDDDMDALRRD